MVANEKLKPIGWNLTIESKDQLYKIAAFLRVKRTKAVIKLIDLMADELVHDKSFRDFVAAYDKLNDVTKDRSSYTSFYIPPGHIEKFEDIMYDFGFIDRSPFLRVLINYVYTHKVKPINEKVIPKVKADIEKLGYKIVTFGPLLEGNVYIQIENPGK